MTKPKDNPTPLKERGQGRKSNASQGLPERKRVNIGFYPQHIEFAQKIADKLEISRDGAVREALERLAAQLCITLG